MRSVQTLRLPCRAFLFCPDGSDAPYAPPSIHDYNATDFLRDDRLHAPTIKPSSTVLWKPIKIKLANTLPPSRIHYFVTLRPAILPTPYCTSKLKPERTYRNFVLGRVRFSRIEPCVPLYLHPSSSQPSASHLFTCKDII